MGGPGLSDLSHQRERKYLPHPLQLGDLTALISRVAHLLIPESVTEEGVSAVNCSQPDTRLLLQPCHQTGAGVKWVLQAEPLQGHGFLGEFSESCGPSVQKDARRHRRVQAAPRASLAPS